MRDPTSKALLAEALNRCMERLESAPDMTPEECISDYPQYRDELKPLVEVAILLRQGAADERFRRDATEFILRKAGSPWQASSAADKTVHDQQLILMGPFFMALDRSAVESWAVQLGLVQIASQGCLLVVPARAHAVVAARQR